MYFWLQQQPLQGKTIYRFCHLVGKKQTNPTPFFFTAEKTRKRFLTTAPQLWSTAASLAVCRISITRWSNTILLLICLVWFSFSHFLGLTSLKDSLLHLAIQVQSARIAFTRLMCFTPEEFVSHLLKSCSVKKIYLSMNIQCQRLDSAPREIKVNLDFLWDCWSQETSVF